MRPFYVSAAWTAWDYFKRVWDNSGEDNVLFLAGGIAFNILLAAVPFVLLLVSGLTYLLPSIADVQMTPAEAVIGFIDGMLPADVAADSGDSSIHKLLLGMVESRATLGIYGAIGFVWFSTRLFGSLRTVLADVFDIESERGIIAGKIFDIQITLIATLLFVAHTLVTTYIAAATTRGITALRSVGLRDDMMGDLESSIGRGIAFIILALMFFALYKYLPIRRVRTKTAWVASLFSCVMFELARMAFNRYVVAFNPASLYSGTLISVIIVVVWCYYAALIFILGGEVGQVYELRRMRKLQREVLT
jgi:membrane protein